MHCLLIYDLMPRFKRTRGFNAMEGFVKIAGNKTTGYWRKLEQQISGDFSSDSLWNKALDIFEERLNERYIRPAEIIQRHSHIVGEGFSIVTILCALIETLETFYVGQCYKHDQPRNDYEYGNGRSESIYLSFLTKREPFCGVFNETLARDFYKNVRCALLHEAMTRNRWVIRISSRGLVERVGTTKILNRTIFLGDIKSYIESYRAIVLKSEERKHAFINKMACICNNA